MTPRRRRTAGPILALLAVPLLLAACSRRRRRAAPRRRAPAAPSAAPRRRPPSRRRRRAPCPSTCPTAQPDPLPAGETRRSRSRPTEGDIVIDIEADLSPIAAGNFVALADCGWYDGVVFHRVVPGFVIQGGDGQYGRSPNVDPSLVGHRRPAVHDQGRARDHQVRARHGGDGPDRGAGLRRLPVLHRPRRRRPSRPCESANTYQIIGTVTVGHGGRRRDRRRGRQGEPDQPGRHDRRDASPTP